MLVKLQVLYYPESWIAIVHLPLPHWNSHIWITIYLVFECDFGEYHLSLTPSVYTKWVILKKNIVSKKLSHVTF